MWKKINVFILGVFVSVVVGGCSFSFLGSADELQPGYYKQIVMQPNGKFITKEKISEKQALSSGLVYKVEFNEQKKLSKITAMINQLPIDKEWFDTTYSCYGSFAVIELEYQDGYIKYRFKNAQMQPKAGYYGAYSLRYKLDEKQNPTIVYFYNKDNEQKENFMGFAQMLFTYDDKGHLAKIGYANSAGERVTTKWKEYEKQLKYKNHNLPIEISNHGKNGELMLDSSNKVRTTYKYDGKDRVVEIRYFGTDGSLKERDLPYFRMDRALGGIGAGAITKYKYEGDKNEPIEISFYSRDEQPFGIKTIDNTATIKIKYGEKGEIKEYSYFGTDGLARAVDNSKLGKNVVAVKQEIDDFGNIIKIAYYNKDNNLQAEKDGKTAVIKLKYDEKRQKIEESYFDTNQDAVEKVMYGQQKYHKTVMEYDDTGKITKTIYYDTSGKEILINPMKNFYGQWVRRNSAGEVMQEMIFTESEIMFAPLLAESIPQDKWKDKWSYVVDFVNINQNGKGEAVLKLASNEAVHLILQGESSMTMQIELSYPSQWERVSYSTKYSAMK